MQINRFIILPILCVITTIIAVYCQFQEPFWSVITVVLLYTEHNTDPVIKAFHRALGTYIGALLGICICSIFANDPFIKLIGIFCITVLGAYYSHTKKYSYCWMLGTGTAVVIILASWISASSTMQFAIWRAVEISLGVIVIMFYHLMFNKKNDNKKEFDTICLELRLERSIKSALACTITALIWMYSHWYGGIVGVVSALIITLKQSEVSLLSTSTQRFIGCVVGAVIGLACKIYFSINFCSVLLCIFVTGLVYSYLHNYFQRKAYASFQAYVAFLIAILPSNNIISTNIFPAMERVAGILLGVIISLLIHFLIWPKTHLNGHQHRNKQNLAKNHLSV